MELFLLGSGTCVPSADRGPSGLVLKLVSHLILVDPGSGSLQQMARLGIDFRKIDFICLTHFHPDHISDLIPFLFATNYTVDFTRTLPLQIIGPPGLQSFYGRLHEIFGRWIEAQSYARMFQEMEASRLEFPDLTIETLPMAHSELAVGYRIDAGRRSLTYSGDTDYCANIITLGKNADLLILECSSPDERKMAGHLTPALAGRIASEASCRRLLLTHFYPLFQGHDILRECQKEFPGPIILAEDGLHLSI